ncbi:cell wall hydrolase [Candidatus Accumulibacter phosphatis]|nr:cell wall hydrolase [Candidatus Accumulibacter phosphatis]
MIWPPFCPPIVGATAQGPRLLCRPDYRSAPVLSELAAAHLLWLWRPAPLAPSSPWLPLVLAFADDAPGGCLLTQLSSADGRQRWPVRSIRAPRCVQQNVGTSMGSARNATCNGLPGTAAAILRGRRDASRLFVLSAAHVFAGSPDASVDDQIEIDGHVVARLRDWQPVLGAWRPQTPIDAAIAEISAPQADVLIARHPGMAQTHAGNLSFLDQPLSILCQQGPLGARFRGWWSGWVDAPEVPGMRDYWLENGLAYLVDEPGTGPGDSGSALVDARGQLLGLHCAGAPRSEVDWNALGCPIGPVLERLGCRLGDGSRHGLAPADNPVRVRAASPAVTPRVADAPSKSSEDTLARTIWGEARDQRNGAVAMAAVAHVVLNRCRKKSWWGRTITEVCRKAWQFTCWNVGDPNLKKLLAVNEADSQFVLALAIAGAAVARLDGRQHAASDRLGDDPTRGATHYYSEILSVPPKWARGKQPCAQIGRHRFFNDIA